jgi:lipopolysaccharide export system protein LptA
VQNNLAISAAVALALAGAATAQEKLPLQLTEDQLLRQIETLSPKSGDPLTKAPASIAELTPGGSAGVLSETVTTTSAVAKDEPTAKKPKGVTEIKADTVDWDQKLQQAVFSGRVVVKDPELDLTCDKLTAFLKNEKASANSGAPATPVPAPKLGDAPKKKSGGLDRAVAEGNVVITQDKLDGEGKPTRSIGRAARADYSAVTGEMILSGNPEVQQGINTCIATAPSTKMYMKRDGKMRVDGPSTMIIRDQGDSKDAR